MTRVLDVILPLLVTVLWLSDAPSRKCEGQKIAIQKAECRTEGTECLMKFWGKPQRDDLDFIRRANRGKPSCQTSQSVCCGLAFTYYKTVLERDTSDEVEKKLNRECQLYGCDTRGRERIELCTHIGCRYSGCMATTSPGNGGIPNLITTTKRPTTTTQASSTDVESLPNDHTDIIDSGPNTAEAVIGPLVAAGLVAVLVALAYLWWKRKNTAPKNRASEKNSSGGGVAKNKFVPFLKTPFHFNLKGKTKNTKSGSANGDLPHNRESVHEYTYIDDVSRPRSEAGEESVYSELDDTAIRKLPSHSPVQSDVGRNLPSASSGGERRSPTSSEDALGYLMPNPGGQIEPSAPMASVYTLAHHNAAFVADEMSGQPAPATEGKGATAGETQGRNRAHIPDKNEATGKPASTTTPAHGADHSPLTTTHDYSRLELPAKTDNSCDQSEDYTPLDHSPRPSPKAVRVNKPAIPQKPAGRFLANRDTETRGGNSGDEQYFILEEGAGAEYSLAQNPDVSDVASSRCALAGSAELALTGAADVSLQPQSKHAVQSQPKPTLQSPSKVTLQPSSVQKVQPTSSHNVQQAPQPSPPRDSKLYNHLNNAHGAGHQLAYSPNYSHIDEAPNTGRTGAETQKIPEYLELMPDYSLQKPV